MSRAQYAGTSFGPPAEGPAAQAVTSRLLFTKIDVKYGFFFVVYRRSEPHWGTHGQGKLREASEALGLLPCPRSRSGKLPRGLMGRS